MTKINEKDMKTMVQIEGAILTPEALETLQSIQDEGNSLLAHFTTELANIICFMLECQAPINKDPEKHECMLTLNNIREVLQTLRKP